MKSSPSPLRRGEKEKINLPLGGNQPSAIASAKIVNRDENLNPDNRSHNLNLLVLIPSRDRRIQLFTSSDYSRLYFIISSDIIIIGE